MSHAAVPRHPRLPVWLRPLTRRHGEIQFGVLPGGPVVSGVSDTEADLLARLDGALPLEVTDAVAAHAGVDPARWRALLGLAAELGVLTDRVDGVRPGSDGSTTSGRVLVDGCGDVASTIVEALSRVVPTVLHGRAAVDRAVASPEHPRPDLVVLVGSPVVDPRRGDVWLGHGVPHLPVTPAGPRTVVGPLVDGSAQAPCLWCLERHRSDRDDAWPAVMSQASPSGPSSPTGPARALTPTDPSQGRHDALDPGLSHLVVGSVTLLVSGLLEGHAPPAGVSVEVSLPWPRMDHRRWPVHPLCPAHPVEPSGSARWASGASPGRRTDATHGLPRGA